MKKIKVSEATGPVLDWMVAKAAGYLDWDFEFPNGTPSKRVVIDGGEPYDMGVGNVFRPSSTWSQGGPIIEREGISLDQYCDYPNWQAECNTGDYHNRQRGPTPLIAAMRCFCASKLGDEVEVPEELA